MNAETLVWHDVADTKPDCDMTVLCWDTDPRFFCGYWDDSIGSWIDCESGGTAFGVTHWASPEGPAE